MDEQIQYQYALTDMNRVLRSATLSITSMQEEACELLQPSSLFLDDLPLLLQGCRQGILDGIGPRCHHNSWKVDWFICLLLLLVLFPSLPLSIS
jgi:hypothetical protein